MSYKNKHIAVIIPYYNAAKHIVEVVRKLPDFIDEIIIIDDKGTEILPIERIKSLSSKAVVTVLENKTNLGVGGATKEGFQFAIDRGVDIVIKIDADDQMDLSYLPQLIEPLLNADCEMAKGNRFRDLKALKKMPFARRSGNLGLSFLTKMATGYWNNFDPTNGYFAIKCSVLKEIELEKLSNRYYFETSLIAELYFIKARIKDIAMPAIYGDEKSNMKVWKMPFIFSSKLSITFLKRIIKSYFLYDFNMASIYIIFGLPLFLFGVIFGITEWIYYYTNNIFAPTGTIMLVTLSIILGFQLLLQALHFDIVNAPKSN
ncbi:MAG: glycosyl transferase family 2 [Bacteroidetes bacterium HGW-Bacteroidetes-23]|uniref:Glycosyltransferase family 2 protein n=1 Tax=Flavobacterium azooxidireducens TaxID=1871076 RepID=A0ABY4KFT1_9FLAO|nr:glycosyltransferase family 2 protein [Flavobacterium azooxidireducens]PKP17356.1 MAG: glycosyl transferase family 2 [Bacteroidetes bacterium HGW-Bacteroidetes-23]UPQ79666.1 glycosyltransferase family 2 protein [Flavobacterium azooxidireducens]